MRDIAFAIIIALIFVSLIIIFCALVIKLYIKKNKEHALKELNFQKTLNSTIIETQEQVLYNISQDLHDDAGQQLTYINFQIENLKLDSPELREVLLPVSESVGLLSQSIRGISHSLNNQLISQQDLFKAMETELNRLQKNTRIALSYSIDQDSKKSFGTDEKIVIYRIFQEALNNAYKHSRAKTISVSVATSPYFEMKVADDGKGFEAKPDAAPSMGLSNMAQRAAIINYVLDIESAPKQGTTIRLSEKTA